MDKVVELFLTDDLYAIIGWNKTDPYNSDKMKRCYKQTCLRYHPDKFHQESEETREIKNEQFKLLQEIHNLLQNDSARRYYNAKRKWLDIDERLPNQENRGAHSSSASNNGGGYGVLGSKN